MVDHYSLGVEWEKQMNNVTENILVFDDLVERNLLWGDKQNKNTNDWVGIMHQVPLSDKYAIFVLDGDHLGLILVIPSDSRII